MTVGIQETFQTLVHLLHADTDSQCLGELQKALPVHGQRPLLMTGKLATGTDYVT